MTTTATLKSPDLVLEKLGTTSDEITSKLEADGITGTPGNASDCVFAAYLKAQGYANAWLFLDPCADALEVLATGWAAVPVPAPIDRFAREFDQGKHPQLIAPAKR